MLADIEVAAPSAEQVLVFEREIPGLVRATGPVSYDFQFGADGHLLDRLIRASWRTPETMFASTASTLAVEAGELAGLEIGFSGADLYRFRAALGEVGRRLIAEGEITQTQLIGLAERAELAGYLNAHVSKGVYYLHALAVRPERRGLGLGARLLKAAMARARAAGFGQLQLDVLSDNPAVDFYKAHGLTVLAEIVSPQLSRDHGFPSELRLAVRL
jgi:ribosomal protein S18 acetylase RimI-like enzyme